MDKEENKKEKGEDNKIPPKKIKPAKESDFKRKYFEFYDDIKISDRQDW
ncbi:MAG: hypothetical protein IJ800_06370 [Clostridia bacterium]|nr:hypothetical protein [Clostridia bacterium]